jgi:phosphoglycolate phosphatase
MRTQPRPLVVFDLDGTLADTALDLVATLNAILAEEGARPVPLEQVRDKVGVGARALLERGFGLSGYKVAPARLDQLYLEFLDRYGRNICVRTRLYSGVVEALDLLEALGYRFAVCTTKVENHAVRLLEGLRIAHRFAAITGRDTFPFLKPDPRHLTATILQAGGDPRHAVMVGDSRTDVAAAKSAGVPIIAVSFGYSDVPVRDLGPDLVIDSFAALPDGVERLVSVAEVA